jgi:hypothetical protein
MNAAVDSLSNINSAIKLQIRNVHTQHKSIKDSSNNNWRKLSVIDFLKELSFRKQGTVSVS